MKLPELEVVWHQSPGGEPEIVAIGRLSDCELLRFVDWAKINFTGRVWTELQFVRTSFGEEGLIPFSVNIEPDGNVKSVQRTKIDTKAEMHRPTVVSADLVFISCLLAKDEQAAMNEARDILKSNNTYINRRREEFLRNRVENENP